MANKKKSKKKQQARRPPPKPNANQSSQAGKPSSRTAPKGRPTQSKAAVSAARQQQMKNRGSWIVLFAGVAVLLGIVGVAVFSAIDDANSGTASSDDWSLPLLNGDGNVELASFEGTPVVLNFFASWCTACEAELPEFREVAEQTRGEVQFVFINSQDSGDGMAMAREFGIDDEVLVRDFGANDSALFRELGGRGMPITAFYDASGDLVFRSSGALVSGALQRQLIELGFI